MTPDARFWNRMARRYARMKVPDEAVLPPQARPDAAYLTPEAQVFEFGCGTGTTALHHAPHAGHIRAVDFAPEMIAIAREKAEAQGITNVDVRNRRDRRCVETARGLRHGDGAFGPAPRPRPRCGHRPGLRDAEARRHFVSSTICLSDGLWFMRPVLPLMRLVRLAPRRVAFFTSADLRGAMKRTRVRDRRGLAAGPRSALFLVAGKPQT
jgi:SAM-dependent methyltransferase